MWFMYCAAAKQNCSQMDSGIGDICTLPLDRSMMQSRFLENGHLSKIVAVKPPAVERFPIRVDDLEDYIMSRRNNNSEELRNEYRVTPSINCRLLMHLTGHVASVTACFLRNSNNPIITTVFILMAISFRFACVGGFSQVSCDDDI